MKENLNVLHVITGLHTGGAEMMLLKLIKNWKNPQYQHHVLSLQKNGTLTPRFVASGVQVTELGISKLNFLSLSKVIKTQKLVSQLKPQIIHGWMYHGNLFAELLKLSGFSRSRTIWSVRQTLYSLKNEKMMTRAVICASKFLSKKPAAITYNSGLSKTQHEKIGFCKSQSLIVPNGFELEQFKPSEENRKLLRAKLNLSEKDILIGMIARFHPMKGYDVLIEAFKLASKSCQNLYLFAAGKNVRDEVIPLVNHLPEFLQKRVFLENSTAKPELILPAFDIACLSSKWGEGFSNFLGESACTGLPCVATDVGDAGLILDSIGRICPPDNPEALASQLIEISKLSTDQRLELGIKLRHHMMNNFSIEKVCQEFESLYEKVLLEGNH